MYECMYVCTYVREYVCMYVREQVCMYIYVCMYLCVYVFNLRILCKKYLQHQQNLYHVFIDFKKAFDRV